MTKQEHRLLTAAQNLDKLLTYIESSQHEKMLSKEIKRNTSYNVLDIALDDEETCWFDDDIDRSSWLNYDEDKRRSR